MSIRLGELSFVNALPLVIETLAEVVLEKTVGTPTTLNRAMLLGQLDVSAVSSAFYLRHQAQFTLLKDISISAFQPVESVLLFLPQGISAVTSDTPLYVPNSSETSIALMQYILHQQTGIRSRSNLVTYPVGQGHALLEQKQPLLAIGDEALRLKTAYQSLPQIDLAEAWHEETGLPFVFAVWVAQKEWAQKNPEALGLINQQLVAQKLAFLNMPHVQSEVLGKAFTRCPQLPQALLKHYLTLALSYHLDEKHCAGLLWFQDVLNWLDNDTSIPLPNRHRSDLSLELLQSSGVGSSL